MLTDIVKRLRSALVGMAAVVAFAGQAQAAVFVGDWDPAFGPAFPQLGWKGSARFEIPDLCLQNVGTYVNGVGCAAGFGLKIISAEVEFYKLSDNSYLDTLYFTAPSATITMEVTKNALSGKNELSGVIGAFLTFDTSDTPLVKSQSYLGLTGATFSLGFVESPLFSGDYYAQMGWAQYRTCNYYSYSYPCKQFGVSDLIQDPNRGPFLTFRQVGLEVPEPGSLALLLPAVGMLAAFRRRKHAPAA